MNQSDIVNDDFFLSNSVDYNDPATLKADNFNLRLRCYNLSNELSKCTCSNNENKMQESRDKLNLYLDPQYDLLEEIKVLKESNEALNRQVDELKTSELKLIHMESIMHKNQQLSNLINKDITCNEMVLDIFKINEDLIRSNVKLKNKILNLEVIVKNEKLRSLNYQSQDNSIYHSKLIKNLNDSLDISKTMDANCQECIALKVSYDKLNEGFLRAVKKEKESTNEVKIRDAQISDLDREIVSLKSQLKTDSRKKSNNIVRNALDSVIRKDQQLKKTLLSMDEISDFFSVELGKANSRLNGQSEEISRLLSLHRENAQTIYELMGVLFKEFPPGGFDSQKLINQLGQSLKSDVVLATDDVVEQWPLLISLVRATCQQVDSYRLSHRFGFGPRAHHETGDMSILRLVDGFTEMSHLARELQESSTLFTNARGDTSIASMEPVDDSGDADSDRYSPQYRVDVQKRNPLRTGLNDKLASFVFHNASLNGTAYQSFSTDDDAASQMCCSAFDTMMSKIAELGDVIHRYSDIVRDFSTITLTATVATTTESFEMLDKSCLAEDDRVHRLVDEVDALKHTLITRDALIENLEDDLCKARKSCDRSMQRINELDRAITDAADQQRVSEFTIRSMQIELNESIDELSTVRAQLGDAMTLMSQHQVDGRRVAHQLADSVAHVAELDENRKHLESELESALQSLTNMSQIVAILGNEATVLADAIRETHARVQSGTPAESNRTTLQMLEDIASYIDKQYQRLSSTHSLSTVIGTDAGADAGADVGGPDRPVSAPLNLCHESSSSTISPARSQAASSMRSAQQGENNATGAGAGAAGTALQDLTNITSFDSYEGKNVTGDVSDLVGFKISCLRDIVDNPDKVLRLLRYYQQTIQDLKRRLTKRYQESKQLRAQIKSTSCLEKFAPVIDQVEMFVNECTTNNENVEEVVKRAGLRK